MAEGTALAGNHEHAFAIDYGAAAAKYVDAFFQNINWDEVEKRLDVAERASTVLGR
jgi:superoxide dismutase, Fe-Mn family